MRSKGSTVATAALAAAAGMACWPGCGAPSAAPVEHVEAPSVVTADIAAGIEQHIAEQVRLGGGRFALAFGAQTLQLTLVRVHMEYLARLGPQRHFACVDLADVSGDVYDVDFFLAGDPGAMAVTETTVHKLNGMPYYAWQQAADKTWQRIPVEAASPRELGIVTGRDAFEFRYRAELPPIGGSGRMWIPYPESDAFQTVAVTSMQTPGTRRMLRDRDHGNRILLLELGPPDGGKVVEIVYDVERREKAVHADAEGAADIERYLKPDRLVPTGGRFEEITDQVLANKQGELVRARALYDHVIDHMRYQKAGTFGTGDAGYACDAGTGNCTEYHSYFMALARSVAVPSRFSIGVAIPSERDGGGIDGYHCWAEFHADGRWWPVDISEGDKYTRLATYYFGHHPANRFELSRGRDLVVEPGPKSGPINFLAYPVLEIDGAPARATVTFSFERRPPTGGAEPSRNG